MFRSSMTIIKELYLYLTKVVYVTTLGKTTSFSNYIILCINI